MTSIEIPISGEITDRVHRLIQRVYYEDTDFSGAVYHARYLHFMERARTDYFRCLGIVQSAVFDGADGGLAFMVHRMEIDFKSPARMDDLVTIATRTQTAHGAKVIVDQEIRRGDQLLAAAKVVIAVINRSGRPRRLPEELVKRLLG
jgi:acyl-CoA thioester hydrolase